MPVRSAHVILTSRCNLRCSYCCLKQSRSESAQRRLACLADLPGDCAITFTGGEPLLAVDELKKFVNEFEMQHGNGGIGRWRIATNGLLLDHDTLEFLVTHRFTVNLSFDGIPAAQSLRGEGTFRDLDLLLDRLRERHPPFFEESVNVRITLYPPAIAYLADSVRYFLDKRVKRLSVAPADGPWRVESIAQLRAQFVQIARDLRRHQKESGWIPEGLFSNGFELRFGRREWTCGAAGGNGIAIDVDGNAYACVLATPTYQPAPAPMLRPAVEALALGRLGSPEFEERLGSLEERCRACGAFDHPERRYSSYRKCADCKYLPRCTACPLAAAQDPTWTDIRRVPDFLCAFNQVMLETRDWFWSR